MTNLPVATLGLHDSVELAFCPPRMLLWEAGVREQFVVTVELLVRVMGPTSGIDPVLLFVMVMVTVSFDFGWVGVGGAV